MITELNRNYPDEQIPAAISSIFIRKSGSYFESDSANVDVYKKFVIDNQGIMEIGKEEKEKQDSIAKIMEREKEKVFQQ